MRFTAMLVVFLILIINCANCGPPKPSQTIYQKERRYNQNVNVNVAVLIKEQNDIPVKPMPNCSGFLVDKKGGIFGC